MFSPHSNKARLTGKHVYIQVYFLDGKAWPGDGMRWRGPNMSETIIIPWNPLHHKGQTALEATTSRVFFVFLKIHYHGSAWKWRSPPVW